MRVAAAALVAVLCASLAPAQTREGVGLHVALVAFVAAEGADLSTTMYCAGAKTCREANPVFAPFVRRPVAAGAFKMGTAAIAAWLLLHEHERHPRLTFWIATIGAAGFSAIATHNSRRWARHGA